MHRRHFRALAEALKTSGADLFTCEAIASVCRNENPRFETRTFLTACGH